MAAESVGSCVPMSPFCQDKKFSSPNAPAVTPNKASSPKWPQYPELPCKACGDPCVVRTSRTEKNPARDFYTCWRGTKCNMFQWCDEVGKIWPCGVNSPVKQNNPVKFNSPVKHNSPITPGLQRDASASQTPKCTCGAGPCRIEIKQNGEYKGRKYFACHLKKGQGLCTHFEWCDGLRETKGKEVLAPDVVLVAPDEALIPNSPEGSRSKRRCVEAWLDECIASPTLGCYLNEEQPMDCENNNSRELQADESPPPLLPQIEVRFEGSRESQVNESPPPLLPPHLEVRLECSPMKRLTLNEAGSSRKPEKCVLCGEVGHGVNECATVGVW